jgi:hypothetical protein
VKREEEWEFPSLRWIHEIREAHYRATKKLPLEAWLKPVDPEKAERDCRRLGLKVRVARKRSKQRGRIESRRRRARSAGAASSRR